MRAIVTTALRLLAALAVAVVVILSAAFLWSSRDTTVYSNGFSEEEFQQLKPGMGLREVYSLLGRPLGVRKEQSPERWCYGEASMARKGSVNVFNDFLRPPRCVLFNEAGVVLDVLGEGMEVIQRGMTAKEVLVRLGQPDRRKPASVMTLHYTEPGGEGLFRARIVAVDASRRVSDVIEYQFYD